jgi:hypothetical protein
MNIRSFVLAAAVSALALPALAQNVDNLNLGALITNSAQVPGTVTSPVQTNTGARGAICNFSQQSEVGNPSTVFDIEFEDSVAGSWQALVTSGAITTSSPAGGVAVMIYPGAVATTVPTNMTIAGLKLPRLWRVKEVVTGGTSTTGGVTCDLLN